MLSFADSSAPGNDAEDWVETHAGRKSTVDSAANLGVIEDIPDLDGDGVQDTANVANAMGKLSISESKGAVAAGTPHLDDIPDMEEDDLEEGDEATAAPKAVTGAPGAANSRYVICSSICVFICLTMLPPKMSVKSKVLMETYCKCELTT